MRILFAALLLALSFPCAAQSAPSAQADALVALARTYGVVRYFHPSDSLDQVDWNRFLVHASARLASVDAGELAASLEELFTPVVEGFRVLPAGAPTATPQGEGPAVEWRHMGFGLETDPGVPYASWRTHHPPVGHGRVQGSYFQHRAAAEKGVHGEPVMRVPVAPGLEAHVPVSLPLSAARIGKEQQQRLEALAAALRGVEPGGDAVSRAQAHADGIAAWNVAAHFYPHWDSVRLDWDATLRQWLASQPPRQTRAGLRDALRRLTAPLDDGQLRIVDPRDRAPRRALPISVRPVGREWIVDHSAVPGQVKAGDVLAAVDGTPADRWFADRSLLVSGSPQVRPWRARLELLVGPQGGRVALRFLRGRQPVDATLTYDSTQLLQGPRPGPMQEVRPGVHYVDLSRLDKAAFDAALPKLAAAKGIVFDLRGAPAANAHALVPYWITGIDAAQWMLVPRFDKPFAQWSAGWSTGWQQTRDPALDKPVKVLVVDARTIGYAESLAAYFPAQRTGPMLGEPTAGANGNPARATLPSGMQLFFTAMRISRHDGETYHVKGLQPDHEARPTGEGLRAGRDEALERAIAVIERTVSR